MNNCRATVRLSVTLVVLAIATFLISGIPRFKNSHHGANAAIGQIDWIVFLVCILALLVTAAVWATKTLRARRRA